MDDQETKQMDEHSAFFSDGSVTQLQLKLGEAVPFKGGGISVTITMLSVEVKMYGWGGCGNNIGFAAKLRFKMGGKEEDVTIGPQPRIFQHGKLRLALGDADAEKGTASIAVAGP
jgi:hypothetical protein